MIKLILIIFVFILPINLLSQEIFLHRLSHEDQEILVSCSTEKKYFLDHYFIKPGKLQERVNQFVFESASRRDSLIKKKFKEFKIFTSDEFKNYRSNNFLATTEVRESYV